MKTCSVRFSKVGKGYTYQFYPDITPVALGDMVLVDAGGKLSVVQVASVSDEEDSPRNPDLKVVMGVIDAEQVRAVMQREKGDNS